MQINVLMKDSDTAHLPSRLMITPGIRILKPARAVERVAVEVTNMTGHAVTLPAKSCLCKLHHVDVLPPNKSQTDNTIDDFSNKFVESLKTNLNSDQVKEVWDMIGRWIDIFSQHDMDLGHAKSVTAPYSFNR